jgi:transcriptional regulator with XRE-family HTH domain
MLHQSTISFRCRRAREKAGISAAALAERAGITRAYISRIESGDRDNLSRRVAQAIAEATGTSVDWLLTGKEPSVPLVVKESAPPLFGTQHAPTCRYPADCDLVQELNGMKTQIASMQTALDTVVSLLGASLHIGAPDKKKVG